MASEHPFAVLRCLRMASEHPFAVLRCLRMASEHQQANRKRPRPKPGPFPNVGVTGFEPATLCSQSRCATKLRYTPDVPSRTWTNIHAVQQHPDGSATLVPAVVLEVQLAGVAQW